MIDFDCDVNWVMENNNVDMKRETVANNLREVWPIIEFRGESANNYNSLNDYVIYGGFERDFFAYWYDNFDCANGYAPYIEDIEYMVGKIIDMLECWDEFHELGFDEIVEWN